VLLRVITEAHTAETQRLAEEHFRRAWNISDRQAALGCLNASEHPRRRELMEEGYALWREHLSAYAGYLAIVGAGTHDDVFEMLAAEEQRPTFRREHPTLHRALYLPMAGNNKMVWTDRGLAWMADTVARLAAVNENTAIRLAAAFQLVHRLADDLKPKVVAALETMRRRVDAAAAPSVAGRIQAYLEGAGAE
jgi:aminopeptidase N